VRVFVVCSLMPHISSLSIRQSPRNVNIPAVIACIFSFTLATPLYAQTSDVSRTTSSKLDAMPTELKKIDIKEGHGAEAQKGKVVVVHYTGWLYDASAPEGKGKKFDSSLDRKVPFGFFLGEGKVIKGWDEGVVGMKVGGVRRLIIPPAMGYGEHGAGGVIPPNATLIFDVELIEVK